MSFVLFFRRCLQDILIKTNTRLSHTSSEDLLNKFSKRLDQGQYFVFAIRLQVVFKTFQRCLQNVLHKRLQDIFKTISRRFEDVFKTSSRHLQGILPRHLQDVFKLPQYVLQKPLQDFLKASPRRLQDIFKKS